MKSTPEFPHVDVTVAVCTYNRGESLRLTLSSLVAQQTADRFSYEILVVDNNSTDATSDIVAEFQCEHGRLLRYVREPRQGTAYARNTAAAQSQADILVYTDDDCTHTPDWLQQIMAAFQTSGADAVQGKITLRLPPLVNNRFSPEFLRRRLAEVDYGNEIIEIAAADLVSANVGLRRTLIAAVGGFDQTFVPCEDTEFSRRLSRQPVKKIYCPGAAVLHWIPEQRLQPRYFFRQSIAWGKVSILLEPPQRSAWRAALGITRTMLRTVTAALLSKDPRRRFELRCRLCTDYGRLCQLAAPRSGTEKEQP